MPLCPQCGKANDADSQFCEACGSRLASPPAVDGAARPALTARPGAAPVCSRCYTVNDAGMGFCRMCGARLSSESVEAEPAAPSSGSATTEPVAPIAFMDCPACGRPTPAGLAFCQNCGTRLGAPASPVTAAAGGVAAQPAVAAAAPTPPVAARPTPPPRPLAVDPAATVRLEARADASVPPRVEHRITPAGGTRTTGSMRVATPPPPPRGRLVLIREGRDVETHVVAGETFDVGRSEGQLLFSGDPYVAARHARFHAPGGGNLRVRPLDPINGVFVRVVGGCDLVPGDVILVGRQVLRYESVGAEERDPPALAEHGVRLLGSAVREAWGRLRQLTPAGTTRDVWHLGATEICIGRRGEVACDDPDLADRHAVVRRGSGRARLEDQGSPGGTFVRLRGERELKGGELLRIGEQLVRFEAAGQAGA